MPSPWPQQGPHGAVVPQPQQSRPPRAASRGTLNCRAAKERSVINPSHPAQRSHGWGGHQPQLSLPGDAAGAVQSLLLGSQHPARGGCHLGWVPCKGWGHLPGIAPTLQVFNPQVLGSYNVLYKLLSTCSCPVCWQVCHIPVTLRCHHGTATPFPPPNPLHGWRRVRPRAHTVNVVVSPSFHQRLAPPRSAQQLFLRCWAPRWQKATGRGVPSLHSRHHSPLGV